MIIRDDPERPGNPTTDEIARERMSGDAGARRIARVTPAVNPVWPYPNGIVETRQGFSLLEIITVLVIAGILVASAGLPLKQWLDGMRVRSGLNRISAEVYRARALAVESGSGASMVIESGGSGCAEAVRVRLAAVPTAGVRAILDLPGVCMRHSGDSVLVFNSRGMLKPPTRSFHASFGSESDSVLLSIAGRIRRSY